MEKVNKGKHLVIRIILVSLLISIFTNIFTFITYSSNGLAAEATTKLVQGGVRFALTGLILYFLYNGKKWAKVLLIVLTALAGISAATSLIVYFSYFMLVMSVAYITIAITLIVSKNVKCFFQYQNNDFSCLDE